jgi:hypothetical protein
MSESKIKEILKLEGYLKINLHFVPKKNKKITFAMYNKSQRISNLKPTNKRYAKRKHSNKLLSCRCYNIIIINYYLC